MTAAELLKELEALGSEQTRKTYRRHGAKDPMFGVSFANFAKLTKKIKIDHALALDLWASGNFDARMLATMIADAQRVDGKLAEAWAKDARDKSLIGGLAKLLVQTTVGQAKVEQWTTAKDEWVCSAGWEVLCHLAIQNNELSDAYFQKHLATIEKDVHASKNFVRYAMNFALISIGVRNEALKKKALAAAKKIGKVEVDHGDTDCQTPDAAAYIEKTWVRKAAKQKGGLKSRICSL